MAGCWHLLAALLQVLATLLQLTWLQEAELHWV
jgi:hypothetical protein